MTLSILYFYTVFDTYLIPVIVNKIQLLTTGGTLIPKVDKREKQMNYLNI